MNLSSKSDNTARKKHLVFINYYFPPMGGGGVQRITKFLKYFDYEKYDVSVITVRPSFFYSADPTLAEEIPRNVRVIRTGSLDPFRLIYLFRKFIGIFSPRSSPQTPSRESRGKVRKIAMSIFVPDSRLMWLPFALGRLWRLNRAHPIDGIIASMPPFTAGLIGILGKRFVNAPTILDFRDSWTANPYLPDIGKVQNNLNEKLEAFAVQHAAGFVFVNPALERYYRDKYPAIQEKHSATIRNGFDSDDFEETPAIHPQPGGIFTLGIMGTIYSQGNSPQTLIQAIKALNQENKNFKKKFRLAFLGKWSPDFKEWTEKESIRDLMEFIPYLPHREALKRAGQFDALALAIDSRFEGSAEVTPGRIYEYLNLRKPILALCPPNGDLADLVRQNNAGEVVEFNDIQRIKQVLSDWVENRDSLAERYRFANAAQYSRQHQTGELMAFIEKLYRQVNFRENIT